MLPDDRKPGEPLGPWTFDHWFGATLVVLIFVGLGLNIWPGWSRIGELFR
jgi:hypothetical protein